MVVVTAVSVATTGVGSADDRIAFHSIESGCGEKLDGLDRNVGHSLDFGDDWKFREDRWLLSLAGARREQERGDGQYRCRSS